MVVLGPSTDAVSSLRFKPHHMCFSSVRARGATEVDSRETNENTSVDYNLVKSERKCSKFCSGMDATFALVVLKPCSIG